MLGFDAPCTRGGHFSVDDARGMVAGVGCSIVPAFVRGARGATPGRYIVTYGASPGVVGHAVALLAFVGGFVVFDGGIRTCRAGHVPWHRMPEG
eukprot:6937152-Pyramimonas_sp.AAC.1